MKMAMVALAAGFLLCPWKANAQTHSNTLTWDASTSGATGYRIYKRTGQTALSAIATVPIPQVSYVDLNVNEGATVFYKVTAFNGNGESPFSVEVSATTPVTSTTPPTPLSSLFLSTTTPANLTSNDTASVELGMKFTSSVAGSIVGIKYYKFSGSLGTHTASLWNSSGARVGSLCTFTNETVSGWQTCTFTSPLAITVGTTYTASYHTIGYVWTSPYLWPQVKAPLSTPVSAGVYRYGTASTFPYNIWNSSNYFVDVLFLPSGPPPVSITIIPTGGTLVAGNGLQFTATVTNATNTGVTWTATGGTISASGLYTAGTTPGTFSITAKSVADGTKIAVASVTINPPPPMLTVNCPTVKSAFTATNMPAGTTLNVSATADGAPPVSCSVPLP